MTFKKLAASTFEEAHGMLRPMRQTRDSRLPAKSRRRRSNARRRHIDSCSEGILVEDAFLIEAALVWLDEYFPIDRATRVS